MGGEPGRHIIRLIHKNNDFLTITQDLFMKVTLEFASQEEYEAFMNEYRELKAEKELKAEEELKQQRKEEFFAAINKAKTIIVEEEEKRDYLRKVLFKQHCVKLSEEQERIAKEWEDKVDASSLARYVYWGGGLTLKNALP